MKLVNARGRVLLEVTDARWAGLPFISMVLYSYRGDGCGGYNDIVGLRAKIEAIQVDAPSAKIEGFLPEPPAAHSPLH